MGLRPADAAARAIGNLGNTADEAGGNFKRAIILLPRSKSILCIRYPLDRYHISKIDRSPRLLALSRILQNYRLKVKVLCGYNDSDSRGVSVFGVELVIFRITECGLRFCVGKWISFRGRPPFFDVEPSR